MLNLTLMNGLLHSNSLPAHGTGAIVMPRTVSGERLFRIERPDGRRKHMTNAVFKRARTYPRDTRLYLFKFLF